MKMLPVIIITMLVSLFILMINIRSHTTGDITGKVIGTGSVSLRIIEANTYASDILLEHGWNLISIPALPLDHNLTTVLASIEGHYSMVAMYNASDVTDPWKKCDVTVPPSFRDLETLQPEYGYWIYGNSSAITLFIAGIVINQTNITMVEGWNLVGYPGLNTRLINESMQDLDGNYSMVALYNASDAVDHWKKYDVTVPASFRDLQSISKYYGYWVYVNVTNEMWRVNWT